MAVVGKTGADALFKYMRLACGTLKRYRSKFEALLDQAVTANVISSADRDTVKSWLAITDALCTILGKLAGFSSVFGV